MSDAEIWAWLEQNGIAKKEIEMLRQERLLMKGNVAEEVDHIVKGLLMVGLHMINANVPTSELLPQLGEIHSHIKKWIDIAYRCFEAAYLEAEGKEGGTDVQR